MSDNNLKVYFYENLFIIDWFWIFLTMTATVATAIYSAITKQLLFVVLILLGSSVLVVIVCHLLAAIFLRKITIDATGVLIKIGNKKLAYGWEEIEHIGFDTEAVETGELIISLLLSVFRVRWRYLKISLTADRDLKPIVVRKKHIHSICRFAAGKIKLLDFQCG